MVLYFYSSPCIVIYINYVIIILSGTTHSPRPSVDVQMFMIHVCVGLSSCLINIFFPLFQTPGFPLQIIFLPLFFTVAVTFYGYGYTCCFFACLIFIMQKRPHVNIKKLPHEMGGLENKQSQLADRKGICI